MRRIAFILLIILGAVSSCHNGKALLSKEFLWQDKDSFFTKGENYQIYYPDTSWMTKQNLMELDTIYSLKNISILDERLSKDLETNRQFKNQGGELEFHFYIIDTLIWESNHYLLLFEKYKSTPPSVFYNSLILALLNEDKIVSTFILASEITSPPCTDLRSSLLISNKKIVSKIISYCTSDAQDANGAPISINKNENILITEYYICNPKNGIFYRMNRKMSTIKTN